MTRQARLFAAVISLVLSGAALAEEMPLSKLDLACMSCGWDKPKVDQSVTKTKLSINGQTYEKGVGTHANSILWVNLDGQAERFTALVGVDDNCRSDKASLEFRIYGDGKKLFDSGVMHYKNAAKPVDVKLTGVKKLLLAVSDAGDGVAFDHADWAEAKFVYAGAAPLAAAAPVEEAVILTPKDPPTPRINGARAWGCRPGNPFQFTIPASGVRPMNFAAENLPDGLKLDPATGIIRGTNPPKGTYVVTLIARNAQGEDRKSLKIVSGDTLALTPHMGWNSWYVWENRVTDQHIRGAADAMVASGMMNHGYMYVNIDDCWARKPKSNDPVVGGPDRDEKGNILTNKRFPDMKALTDYIHSKGLLAGIYTGPGPTTCAGHTAAYQHEELDAKQFADWGYDFLKYDWCSYGNVVKGKNDLETLKKPYKLMGDILKQQKRDIVLNLCQYGMGKVWEWGRDVGGHSWRTAGDLG
ncbi:MAG: NPCBM/NEW2 domain-containing protein, partial [Tepidisphaerales bacterium]